MVSFEDNNITEIHYNGYTISKVYACGGYVYGGESPTPPTPPTPTPTDLKLYATYTMMDELEVECSGIELTQGEVQNGGHPPVGNMLTAHIGGCAEFIDVLAFATASNLREVVMDAGVVSIGNQAFSECRKLSAVTIPDSVMGIGDEAFKDCSGITTLNIGSGITRVGSYAFSGCTNITNDLVFPNIDRVESYAFYGCRKLHSVRLGSGCTRIEGNAFNGCTGMTGITIEATTPPYCAPYAFANTSFPIYVPSESIETYKTTYAWSTISDRIQAIT